MLLHYATRVARVRQLLTPTLPLPRRPFFFSTTAHHFRSLQEDRSKFSGSLITPTEDAQSESDSESMLTNQTVTPVSVSFTVSPPPTFAFLKPTPVVLLTAPFGGNWCFRDTWQASLADQGYQSTSIELKMPSEPLATGDEYIRHFTKALKTSIEIDHSFYPPILIAHGLHALVAQKYVESNPVSALVLVSPFIPSLINERFQDLSRALMQSNGSGGFVASGSSSLEPEASHGKEPSEFQGKEDGPTTDEADADESQLQFHFETHADVLAQPGFKERYVLPKKAVYKIDQIAKEHQEREKKEREEKEKISRSEHAGAAPDMENGTAVDASSSAPRSETIGNHSAPVQETTSTGSDMNKQADVPQDNDDALPEQIVEAEASIPSPLEELPLSIYDSMQESVFEPNFPILLVTCNGDEIVSTDDVKEHHDLAELVDHIELEDLDDGGHLIMVGDNTEWEQGIQGITAWLDSNGM